MISFECTLKTVSKTPSPACTCCSLRQLSTSIMGDKWPSRTRNGLKIHTSPVYSARAIWSSRTRCENGIIVFIREPFSNVNDAGATSLLRWEMSAYSRMPSHFHMGLFGTTLCGWRNGKTKMGQTHLEDVENHNRNLHVNKSCITSNATPEKKHNLGSFQGRPLHSFLTFLMVKKS